MPFAGFRSSRGALPDAPAAGVCVCARAPEVAASVVFVETTNRTKSLDPRSPGIPAYFKNIRISLLTQVCGAAATLRGGRDKGAEFIEDVMPKTLVNIFNIIVYTVVPKHTSCAYLALFLLISLSPAHKRKSREGEAGWVFVETTNRTKSLGPHSPGIPAYF